MKHASVFVLLFVLSAACLAADGPRVQFDTSHIGPRQMEDVTGRNIPRDWGRAWQTLAAAYAQNRPDLLGHYFTGFAQQKLTAGIVAQEKTGLRTRYIDHGHKLAAYFYSPDGGVMQLQDDAQYEVQIYDGAKLLSSERTTARFLVLMTPAADRWMVRLLQNVPAS